jgi:hypothetical protein
MLRSVELVGGPRCGAIITVDHDKDIFCEVIPHKTVDYDSDMNPIQPISRQYIYRRESENMAVFRGETC